MNPPRLITPPAALPVTLPEAKRHLRVDWTEEDADIQRRIAAATARFDGWSGVLGRALEPQTWELRLDRFPAAEIELPLGPVVSVEQVAYVDVSGVLQIIPPAAYEVDAQGVEGWIVPVAGASWPEAMETINAVRLRWVAGNGCPDDVREAILQTVAYWYDNRDKGGGLPPGTLKSLARLRRVPL